MPYDSATDSFTCPNGQKLIHKKSSKEKNTNGFERTTHFYESLDCKGCSFAEACKKTGQETRSLTINLAWDQLKSQARTRLMTEQGIALKKRRSVDVESSFGDIKHNQGYHRFRLRGLKKVTIEWGLIAISHNLRKVAIKIAA